MRAANVRHEQMRMHTSACVWIRVHVYGNDCVGYECGDAGVWKVTPAVPWVVGYYTAIPGDVDSAAEVEPGHAAKDISPQPKHFFPRAVGDRLFPCCGCACA